MSAVDPMDRNLLETIKLDQDIRTELARRRHWRIQQTALVASTVVAVLMLSASVLTLVLKVTGVIG